MEALLKEKEQLVVAGESTQQEVQQTPQASTSDSSKKLLQTLGELSLTNKENEKLMVVLTKMEENKIKKDNAYLAEVQRNFKLTRQIQKYENQSLTAQMLGDAKKSIWHNINSSIK